MTTRTQFPDSRMTRAEIKEALHGVRPGLITDLIESMGWTLQETTESQIDIWTKWHGGEVSEIHLPEPGMGVRDAAESPRAIDAVMKLALLDQVSHRYILQKLIPHRMGAEPVPVILEDITRSGVRRVLTEKMSQDILPIMDRQSPDDPSEVKNLLWRAHLALTEAAKLMEGAEMSHVARLAERLAEQLAERSGETAEPTPPAGPRERATGYPSGAEG